jgi:hypothetical protein
MISSVGGGIALPGDNIVGVGPFEAYVRDSTAVGVGVLYFTPSSNGGTVVFRIDEIRVDDRMHLHFVNNATTRPTFVDNGVDPPHLDFDGVNDFGTTRVIDGSAFNAMSMSGTLSAEDAAARIALEFSENNNTAGNNGTGWIVHGANLGTGWQAIFRGNSFPAVVGQTAFMPDYTGVPSTDVIITDHSIPLALSTIEEDGVAGTNGTASKGGGGIGTERFYIASRGGGSLFYNGNMHGMVIRIANGFLSAGQKTDLTTWLNDRKP